MKEIRIEISVLPRDMHLSKEKKIWSVAEDHWSLVSGEYINSELLTYDEAVSLCHKVFTLLNTKTFIVFVDNNTRIELGEKPEYDNLLISSPVENRNAPEYKKIWAVVNMDKNIEISDKKVTKAEANNICIDSFNKREGNSFLIYVPDAKYKNLQKKTEEVNIKIHKKDIDRISENKKEWSVLLVDRIKSNFELLTYEEAVSMAELAARITGNTNFLVYANSDNTEKVLNFEEFKNVKK